MASGPRSMRWALGPGPLGSHWWSLPWRLYMVLQAQRSAHPAPITYIGAALVGAAAGALTDVLWDIPWWSVALGAVVATWLVFMATAFTSRRRRRGGRNLWVRLLDEIDPDGHEARRERLMRKAFERAPFPLYGLDRKWSGPRWIGGWGESSSHGPRLTLAHGDARGEGAPVIRMTMSREPGGTNRAWMEFELLHTDDPGWRPSPRVPVFITVNGQEVEFEAVQSGNEWFAVGAVEATCVAIDGTNVEPDELRLERISDLEPYLRGLPRRGSHH